MIIVLWVGRWVEDIGSGSDKWNCLVTQYNLIFEGIIS